MLSLGGLPPEEKWRKEEADLCTTTPHPKVRVGTWGEGRKGRETRNFVLISNCENTKRIEKKLHSPINNSFVPGIIIGSHKWITFFTVYTSKLLKSMWKYQDRMENSQNQKTHLKLTLDSHYYKIVYKTNQVTHKFTL